MNRQEIQRLSRSLTIGEVASRASDPHFYAVFGILPNPDVILRRSGKSEEVFEAIQADAHVIGELRSVRASLLRFQWRLNAGGDEVQDKRALELCETVMSRRPAPGLTWPDVIWNMGSAVFRGFRVHEVVWDRQGDVVVPIAFKDRPNRRFGFDPDGYLRLLTRENMLDGVPTDERKFLLTRHMSSCDNPYGIALFSSCFWPYTFKHAGFKWFVKFCERMGIPVPVGKYPAGTPPAEQEQLEKALANLVEAAYIAIQDGGSVELLEAQHGAGTLAQQALVQECNREMSKALTSQTLATEINDVGARAASETARGRELSVNESDRELIAYTMDEWCRWVTELNIGPDAKPPTFEFYEEQEARKERADVYDIVLKNTGRVSRRGMFAELGIPMADDDEDSIGGNVSQAPGAGQQFSKGTCPHCHGHFFAQDPIQLDAGRAAELADAAIEKDLIDPIHAMLVEFEAQGRSLAEFQDELTRLYPALDQEAMARLTAEAMSTGYLRGMAEASED